MKFLAGFYPFRKTDTKFIFEVGGGSEAGPSSAETQTTSTPSTETQDPNISDIYEQIRGQLKPEEISDETQQALFQNYSRFDTIEKAADYKISQNNTKISEHQAVKSDLTSQRKALIESNDSEAESSIILGLMPNSHEDFVAYVKNNRPGPEAIRGFLDSDDLEEIPQTQIDQVSQIATQMVVKLNQIDQLAQKIAEEQAEIEKYEASNAEEEAKKDENREQAQNTLQGIMNQNIPPEPEEDTAAPSMSYQDRKSELPEMAAPEVGTSLLPDSSELEDLLPDLDSGNLDQATEDLATNSEAISDLVEQINISPAAREKLMENIRNLEFFPDASEAQIAQIVLAGVDGLTVEQITDPTNPFYSALRNQIDLIRAKHEARAQSEEQEQRNQLTKIANFVERMSQNEALAKYALSAETYASFQVLYENITCGHHDQINFDESLALIDRAITEIENTDFSGSEFHQFLTAEQRTDFANSKRDYLATFDTARNDLVSVQNQINMAERRAQQAAETRSRIENEIQSYATTPGKREAAQEFFDSKIFQESGELGEPAARFLSNPASDFSPENVAKVINLLNSDDYLNASEEAQTQMFESAGINLASSYGENLNSLSPEQQEQASSFISALPQGASAPTVLENGNLAYEASGVSIEVDIANNKMFPRSADGRARTWLSMEASPINTPAIQFFSAAMDASVDDKEDGFASIMRGGGQWKNEIFWRNLLAPTTGRSLQHKEIAGIKAIENTVGIQRLMTHLDLIDENGNFVPGNAASKRDEFFDTLIAAANGSFEAFAENPTSTPLTELPE